MPRSCSIGELKYELFLSLKTVLNNSAVLDAWTRGDDHLRFHLLLSSSLRFLVPSSQYEVSLKSLSKP